ncbi:MAG: SPOR domain-containing protein [Burkholderiales bacterium]
MRGNDEALELRRRARRRLIGAIAVVLALVLIPPWVMDLEPKPVVTNLTVEIPKQQPGGLKLPAAPAGTPAPAKTPAAVPAARTGASEAVPRPPDVKPESGLPGERPKAAAIARAAPSDAAHKEAEAKRAEAILNAEAFVVPLGAFANRENVKQLEAKLSKAGVKYFTETVSTPGGEQTRVRAGPFPSKDAAEGARERLKTLGLSPGAAVARQ